MAPIQGAGSLPFRHLALLRRADVLGMTIVLDGLRNPVDHRARGADVKAQIRLSFEGCGLGTTRPGLALGLFAQDTDDRVVQTAPLRMIGRVVLAVSGLRGVLIVGRRVGRYLFLVRAGWFV